MSSKGAGDHFGNSRGGKQGKASDHIGFAWAKDFNKSKLKSHFKKHGKEMKSDTIESYRTKAIHFANYIDRENCISFVDKKETTHKFNKITNEYAIIDKKGYVITYYILKAGIDAFLKEQQNKARKKKK